MKRFKNFLNESEEPIYSFLTWKLMYHGNIYYIITQSNDTKQQITFDENGEQIQNFTDDDNISDDPNASVIQIEAPPKQVIDTLKKMNALRVKQEVEEPTPEEPTTEKSYVEMGQKELNYQLNIAIEKEDWDKAERIAYYIKEK